MRVHSAVSLCMRMQLEGKMINGQGLLGWLKRVELWTNASVGGTIMHTIVNAVAHLLCTGSADTGIALWVPNSFTNPLGQSSNRVAWLSTWHGWGWKNLLRNMKSYIYKGWYDDLGSVGKLLVVVWASLRHHWFAFFVNGPFVSQSQTSNLRRQPQGIRVSWLRLI